MTKLDGLPDYPHKSRWEQGTESVAPQCPDCTGLRPKEGDRYCPTHYRKMKDKPILTPWQELNARTIGRFLGLAREAKHGLDHQYLVDQLVGIAEEYQRQDEALLNALPRSK